MKTKTLLSLLVLASFAVTGQAFAGSKFMSACKKDLKKFSCKAKTDKEAHECLEAHQTKDAKDEGFSHKCYEANEAFEAAEQGSGEHHDESTEHHEEKTQ